jgi:hypothetical protein
VACAPSRITFETCLGLLFLHHLVFKLTQLLISPRFLVVPAPPRQAQYSWYLLRLDRLPPQCLALAPRFMSRGSGTELELATLPTNSNGMCRSSIATRYHDQATRLYLAIYTPVDSRNADVGANYHHCSAKFACYISLSP